MMKIINLTKKQIVNWYGVKFDIIKALPHMKVQSSSLLERKGIKTWGLWKSHFNGKPHAVLLNDVNARNYNCDIKAIAFVNKPYPYPNANEEKTPLEDLKSSVKETLFGNSRQLEYVKYFPDRLGSRLSSFIERFDVKLNPDNLEQSVTNNRTATVSDPDMSKPNKISDVSENRTEDKELKSPYPPTVVSLSDLTLWREAAFALSFFGYVPVLCHNKEGIFKCNTRLSQEYCLDMKVKKNIGFLGWRGDSRPYHTLIEGGGFVPKALTEAKHYKCKSMSVRLYEGLAAPWSRYMCHAPWELDPRYLIVQGSNRFGFLEKARVCNYVLWRNNQGDNDTESCISIYVDLHQNKKHRLDKLGPPLGGGIGKDNELQKKMRKISTAFGAACFGEPPKNVANKKLKIFGYKKFSNAVALPTFVYLLDIRGMLFRTFKAQGEHWFPEVAVPFINKEYIIGWICYLRLYEKDDPDKSTIFTAIPVSDLSCVSEKYRYYGEVEAAFKRAFCIYKSKWTSQGFDSSPPEDKICEFVSKIKKGFGYINNPLTEYVEKFVSNKYDVKLHNNVPDGYKVIPKLWCNI